MRKRFHHPKIGYLGFFGFAGLAGILTGQWAQAPLVLFFLFFRAFLR